MPWLVTHPKQTNRRRHCHTMHATPPTRPIPVTFTHSIVCVGELIVYFIFFRYLPSWIACSLSSYHLLFRLMINKNHIKICSWNIFNFKNWDNKQLIVDKPAVTEVLLFACSLLVVPAEDSQDAYISGEITIQHLNKNFAIRTSRTASVSAQFHAIAHIIPLWIWQPNRHKISTELFFDILFTTSKFSWNAKNNYICRIFICITGCENK